MASSGAVAAFLIRQDWGCEHCSSARLSYYQVFVHHI